MASSTIRPAACRLDAAAAGVSLFAKREAYSPLVAEVERVGSAGPQGGPDPDWIE